MSEFGAQLKQARESRGISLRQIATATKISPVALESLERGDLSKLPGGIFSRAFVRAYAIEVGLDPDETVAQFLVELGVHESRSAKDEVRPEVTADDRAFLEQQRRAAIGLRIAVGILVLLIIASVMAWRIKRGEPSASVPVPAPAAAADSTLTQAQPSTPAPAGLWIEVTATDTCWVEVTTDGTARPGRLFTAGERQRFDAAREIVLQVGSAGAVSLVLNGRPGRSLGQVGEVRTVTISLANVEEFYRDPAERPTPTASATAHP